MTEETPSQPFTTVAEAPKKPSVDGGINANQGHLMISTSISNGGQRSTGDWQELA